MNAAHGKRDSGHRDIARVRSRVDGPARRAVVLTLVLGLPLGAQAPTARSERQVCVECHEGAGARYDAALAHAPSLSCLSCHHIAFTKDAREAVARREQACQSCHSGLAPTHVEASGARVPCTGCHRIHGNQLDAAGRPRATTCSSCHARPHALHERTPGRSEVECTACHTLHVDSDPRVRNERVAEACVSCHTGVHPSHAGAPGFARQCTTCHSLARGAPVAPAADQLTRVCTGCHESVPPAHGTRKHQAAGVLCTDCHSLDRDPRLPAAAVVIAGRCGECHGEAMRDYRAGGHSSGLAPNRPNGDAPTCVTCHPQRPEDAAEDMRLAITMRCVGCHSNDTLARKYNLPLAAGATYLADFHGATLRFRSEQPQGPHGPDVMICADCHGAHNVGVRDSSALQGVCARCHTGADAKLAGAWLGHEAPGPRNGMPVWLVRLAYTVLIPFMLLGLTINIGFHYLDQRRKGAKVLDAPGLRRWLARLAGDRHTPESSVERFSRVERLEHLVVMVCFVLLVLTGLPQRLPDVGASMAIVQFLGGIAATRLIHRVTGFVFVALLVFHVGRAVVTAIRTRRLPAMVPTRADFHEVVGTLSHFMRGTPRPRVGKFDFAQRFEYWGLFLGGVVMSVTGVALVYPEFVARVLPGLTLAVFRNLHGLEATLAVLVVTLWHAWGVLLRPEIFPLDSSIFTRRITVERLKEEYPLEYDRLFPNGG